MNAVIFSYEYADPIFSGNGTHSRVLAKSLASSPTFGRGSIFVICAVPSDASLLDEECIVGATSITTLKCPVNPGQWRRLDVLSDWQGYCSMAVLYAGSKGDHWDRLRAVVNDQATVFLPVDWSGFAAMDAVVGHRQNSIYLNFRVFSLSDTPEGFYRQREKNAVLKCGKTAVLSEYDRCQLREMIEPDQRPFFLLAPPVRQEFLDIVKYETHCNLPAELICGLQSLSLNASTTHFLLCCVRVSKEKQVERFTEAVTACMGVLKEKNLIPVLIGSSGDQKYASDVHAGLMHACEGRCIILKEFIDTKSLIAIFRQSYANIHPSSYDAFGLTISEAACCRCPSVILTDDSGSVHVGAADFLTDGVLRSTINNIAEVLSDVPLLQRTADIAFERAFAYSFEICGANLVSQCVV